jgi:murein DD-endopeptidase MepM/ murein hydrolase activator NlpD
VAKVSQILGEQLFPERRLLLQSSAGVHHLALPGWLQAMLLAASLATIGAVAYLCVGFMHLRDTLDSRGEAGPAAPSLSQLPAAAPQIATAPAAAGNAASLDEMRSELTTLRQQVAALNQSYSQANSNYQQAADKLAALTQQNTQLQSQLADATARIKTVQDARDDAEHRAKTNEQALSSKSGNTEQLAKNLDASKGELKQSEVERTTLQNRVQQLEMDLQAAQARAEQLDARNQQLAADPQRIAPPAIGNAQAAPMMVPPVSPDAALPERKPAPTGVPHAQNNQNSPSGSSSDLEKLLASTGVNIDRMLQGLGNTPGEGGPYIALNDPRAAALDRQRLDDLKRLAKMLPLAAPLNQFTVGSPFGPRIDPINHRDSFHPGLDLDAPYMTTVFSTAPGTVMFTGNMDSYGRVVEIDHGHGIVTRYAHLHRILVAKGQKVALHTPIGELGSTGRSTGPHLHYEVHVDGVAVDPAKFMQAGKNVVQVSGQQ